MRDGSRSRISFAGLPSAALGHWPAGGLKWRAFRFSQPLPDSQFPSSISHSQSVFGQIEYVHMRMRAFKQKRFFQCEITLNDWSYTNVLVLNHVGSILFSIKEKLLFQSLRRKGESNLKVKKVCETRILPVPFALENKFTCARKLKPPFTVTFTELLVNT